MANLHGLENFQRAGVTARTRFTGIDCTQVGPLIDFDIAFDFDAANVMLVFVCAGRHVAAAVQTEVRDDEQILIRFVRLCFRTHPAQTAGAGSKQFADLFRMRRACCC